MSREPSLVELGAFLRARRAELNPQDLGLASAAGRRRVQGLRREEVAQRANISADYYTRLEQGRVHASAAVLTELADVLRLNSDQRAYLYELAGKPPRRRHRPTSPLLAAPLQRMLDDLRTTPAFVIGPKTEVLAWNALAAAVFTDFGAIPAKDRLYIRLLFSDPAMRTLYEDWEEVAKLAIQQLRMHSTSHTDDPELAAIVGELSLKDPQFREWWAAREVTIRSAGAKTLRHPLIGTITLDWTALTGGPASDQQIIIWTAAPGTPSHDALSLLASWTATPGHPIPADINDPAT